MRFEPCSDDGAIAEDIVVLDQYFAEMDADAKAQPLGFIEAGVAKSEFGLCVDHAAQGIIDTCKFVEQRVTRRVDAGCRKKKCVRTTFRGVGANDAASSLCRCR